MESIKSISLSYLAKYGELKSGYINLYGSTGICYRSLALYIPKIGWVPCSRKLKEAFTRDPNKLMLVIRDGDEDKDKKYCVTSDVWVTLSNIVRTLGSELKRNK